MEAPPAEHIVVPVPEKPVLVVEELPPEETVLDKKASEERLKTILKEMNGELKTNDDDACSIKSYDVADINVDCGWKDICGAHVHGYESDKMQFGYFPESFDTESNINTMTPMLAHVFGARMHSNEHIKTYTIHGDASYSILSTPKQKLIRIKNKIMPLDAFLELCHFEGNGNVVHCKFLNTEKTHTFYDIDFDTLSAIYIHAHYNL